MPLQRVQHFLHQVINVEQLQPGAAVVDLNGQIMGNVVAEGGNHAVVVGAAPFSEQVGEPVNQHGGAGLPAIVKEQIFPRQLAGSVIRLPVPADEGGLDGAGQHDRAGVAVAAQRVQQGGGKSEIALHELAGLLRPVDPRQIEHKIRLLTPGIQQGRVGVQIVRKDLLDGQTAGAVFAGLDGAQIFAQIAPHKAPGAGD